MRLTDDMNFPHPVLAPWRDDFNDGEFTVDVTFREDRNTGQVDLHFAGTLKSAAMKQLIPSGKAKFGCFVVCIATGVRRLIDLGTLPSTYTFAAGELLDTVTLRPLIWMTDEVPDWTPPGVHKEFSGPQKIRKGDIIAMAEELAIEVSQADLPAIETIFDLKVSEGIPEGQFDVDMTQERITILAAPETKALADTLRKVDDSTRAVIMNSLYVPSVMCVLIALGKGEAEFSGLRWFEPFMRRCRKLDVEPNADQAFADALKLLECPFRTLSIMTESSDQ